MRMWMVNPSILCRKHLLGEHLECHMFLSHMTSLKSINGYVYNNLLEIESLLIRHDALSVEMLRRGYKHASPLRIDTYEEFLKFYPKSVFVKINIEKSLNDLLCRCIECKKRYEGVR